MSLDKLEKSVLGKNVQYKDRYDPSLLFPISRQFKRDELGFDGTKGELPFHGGDIWNSYELSWCNLKGCPQVAMATFYFPCDTPNLIESKSFKLYLNSFNQTQFKDKGEVAQRLEVDLSEKSGGKVKVEITPLELSTHTGQGPKATLLDQLDIEIKSYDYDKNLLKLSPKENGIQVEKEEKLVTHLLKSNCLVTGQPDWGTLYINYQGASICHESLLRYVISFRNHNEFHEQCVERIFTDINLICRPKKLTVFACYTRRGGLDINPLRSNFEQMPTHFRTIRQ